MNSGGILFNPVQHWICVCLCCHSPWSYEVCLANTAVLSVFVYFTTFLMYSNCFSKTLHLLSVPNKWDVSSWLSVHSSFLVSFSLSCSHLLLWIRFSHFVLLNLFNSKCWLFSSVEDSLEQKAWQVLRTATAIISWLVQQASAAPGGSWFLSSSSRLHLSG